MENVNEVSNRSKNKQDPPSSKLLGSNIKKWWLLLVLPIENYLIEKKVHPNILTISTLIVSVLTGVCYHSGLIFLAGILILAGSTFDIFDGRVARALDKSSERGAFFDSSLDRISEAFIYLGLLSYFQGSIFVYVVFLILVSSTMVSYTRARAEGLGIDCEVGIMQRTERIVYLGVLSIFNYFVNQALILFGYDPGDYMIKLALLIILIFSSYTAYQRMSHVMHRLKERDGNNDPDSDEKTTIQIH